jgi:3-(3-hydroxy-phenyl)propionate hydroxylase
VQPHRVFPYRRHPDQDCVTPVHHRVIIIGAGPTGLSAAIDLQLQGVDSVVLDDNTTVSVGSRAICFAQRTLEIFDRYGCAQPMLERGVQWQLGKVFFKDALVYEFNLRSEGGHRMPPFINLQQYYVEAYLVDRAVALGGVDIRWSNQVIDVRAGTDQVSITVKTPDGNYALSCDYLLVADGANSSVRQMLGLDIAGQVFNDQFLITDIKMKADFPTERRFHFDPPFHPNQSVLLHRQADDVWRIDFQLGPDADPAEALLPESIRPRIAAMLGADLEWELEWASVYTFRCQKMDRFEHGRVFFAGDAAHQVAPFGARGANSAVQSAENLAWKLARVLHGRAPAALLTSYDEERQPAAQENILNSIRTADFMTPKSPISRVFRDSVLRLARDYSFARTLVNSGRLSVPCSYPNSALNTPDTDRFEGGIAPGSVCPDAPITCDGHRAWLQQQLGNRFVLLLAGEVPPGLTSDTDLSIVCIGARHELDDATVIEDVEGLVQQRYALAPGSAYLIRPDQYVCARWRQVDTARVMAARRRALGLLRESAT